MTNIAFEIKINEQGGGFSTFSFSKHNKIND
jgi:hypothetical protein